MSPRRLHPRRRGKRGAAPVPAERGSEAGFAALEVTLLGLVLVAFMVAIAVLGVVVHAKLGVESAARVAAEAAAQAPTSAAAASAARSAAEATLAGAGASCAGGPTVTVDLARFAPGGQAAVSVACRAVLPAGGLAGLAGSVGVHASATQPVDPYVVIGAAG